MTSYLNVHTCMNNKKPAHHFFYIFKTVAKIISKSEKYATRQATTRLEKLETKSEVYALAGYTSWKNCVRQLTIFFSTIFFFHFLHAQISTTVNFIYELLSHDVLNIHILATDNFQ